jgi:hypothetical protein
MFRSLLLLPPWTAVFRSPPSVRRVTSSASASAASDNEAAVRSLLLAAGLSPEQLSLAFARAPRLASYDAKTEVAARLSYLTYLRDESPTRWAVSAAPAETPCV